MDTNSTQRYHFTLLRNLYEKTANFLGYSNWKDILPDDKKEHAHTIMHFYSHNTLSNETVAEPTPPEQRTITDLLKNLDNYGYLQEEKPHD